MNPYANNKVLHHIDRLYQIKQGKRIPPVHLYMYPSDLCNHNCGFCAYRMEGYTSARLFPEDGRKNPNRMIPLSKAIEILGDARDMGVKAVQFSGGGEPAMHEDFGTILQVTHTLGLQTGVVTNGSRLDSELRKALLGSEWVRISIDAAKEETYTKIHGLASGHGDLEQVLTNISRLVEDRNSSSGSGLFIGVGFVVTEENWREIPLTVELAKTLGVDNLRFTAAFTTKGRQYYDSFYGEASSLCRKAARLKWVSSSFDERVQDLARGHPGYSRCVNQQLTTVVGADLNLYACCVVSYNERGLIGSLKDKRLVELWNSRQRWNFVDNFDARKCERCQFNVRNRRANILIDGLPELHGDFV